MTFPSSLTANLLADRYTIEREIGRGGMATVFLAEERKHGRKVAIKVLHPELAASLGSSRFLQEIGIAARLSHPHLVPLIDSGDADGSLYYVSPFVDGGSLRTRLDRDGRLSVRDAIYIAEEVGMGLDFAHRSGFVHRDVKPENILFADGHALLADFGIARACGASERQTLTDAGIAVGTPEYMSPEQASGERHLDGRSDIYSLAVVVYEMLTGAPPLRGSNARSTMAKQVTETPPPLRAVRPDVPPAVERVILRALAKEPGARFETVMDFIDRLKAAENAAPQMPTTAIRSVAVLPFVNASPDPENEYLSDGITDELIDALTKVEGVRVASRTSVFALKGKPQDIRAIGALLGVSVVMEGTVRKSGERLRITAQLSSVEDGRLLWSQRYDRTLDDVFTIQEEISRTIVNTLRATSLGVASDAPPKRYTDSVTAYGLYLRGRYEWNKRTQKAMVNAIDYFEQAIAADPNYALAYTGLADAYALQLDYRSVPVAEGFAHAKAYARKALELDETLPEAHASLAWSEFIYDWDWESAEREFRRAIELNPRYAVAHQWYAFLLAAKGQMDEALVEGHTAQELDSGSVSARRGLGFLYYYARRYERAADHLLRGIAMNPVAEETYRVLGLVLSTQEEHAEAERVLREALALSAGGTLTRATLGYALGRAGKRDEAEKLLDELEREARGSYVSPVAFATMHLGLGNVERALDWAEQAYAERRGWLTYVKVHPMLDPARGHPRLEALIRKMGI
ncbi:MAG TPA: protein kinase [Gemmatimonadaceae bacterium]|jgi:serine/threonine protein kinase/tetratricopeptide (TPR) repeat protein|nr:protein kinase [Gemmatimonadaceae bacterium]